MFRQLGNPAVEKKIDGGLIPKSIIPPPGVQKLERAFKKKLFPQFIEIHQHHPAIKVSAFARKIDLVGQDSRVIRQR